MVKLSNQIIKKIKFHNSTSKITSVVKIGIFFLNPNFLPCSTMFTHVSVMMASSKLIMASLSMLFLVPFPPIVSPSFLFPPPAAGSGMGELPVVWCFALCGRYFHSPTDTKELLYDPASVMNGDTLKFCLKEAWCKLSFFVLSFFYYLYWWVVLGCYVFGWEWGGDNWITCKEITLIWLQQLK